MTLSTDIKRLVEARAAIGNAQARYSKIREDDLPSIDSLVKTRDDLVNAEMTFGRVALTVIAQHGDQLLRSVEALELIKNLDPEINSPEGGNEWGEADCFGQAQNIAREALQNTGEKA